MTAEPLFEGHDIPVPPSTHVLVVDASEEVDDRIECSGVHPTCEGWQDCDEEHSLEDEEAVDDAGTEPHILHDRPHLAFEDGLAVPTGKCVLVDVPETWQGNYRDDLEPGRYDVRFVFEEERSCHLSVEGPAAVLAPPAAVEVSRSATISEDGRYRYTLSRTWGTGKAALFIMLNPSTADGELDDPTIRRCMGFARREGCDGLTVVNLFAWRATRPDDLWDAHMCGSDVVGPRNDLVLAAAIGQAKWAGAPVIAGWGVNARPARVHQVLEIAATVPLLCLGLTKEGHPKHPLYIRADAPLVPFGGDA